MSVTQTFDLNLIPEQAPVVIHCDQYDKGTGRLIIKLYDGDVAYTPTGTAKIQGRKPDEHGFVYSAALSGNTVTADLTEQMSAVSGHVRCQVVVTESTGRTGSFAFILDVQPSALPDDTDLSDSDFQYLEDAIDRAEQAADDAEIAETNAEGHAEDAEAWAVGERGGVPVGPTDPTYDNNAKYWADKASQYAQGALHFMGSIPFASIPTTGMSEGDMYNITDDFTTDSRFMEGSGKFCPAGTNIAWIDSASKWDVLSIMKIGSLDDLTDVSIISPLQGGQYLGYNPVSQEFENRDLPDMSNATKGIGQPDGITTGVSLGIFSAIGVNIPAEVNSGATPHGAQWLYYAGTTTVITPEADQNYRVTDNGTTKLYFWNGSAYEVLSGSGGGSGDYMGLYGMTEIQSSDGQGTTVLDLDTYTTVGNYYCNGKGKITINAIKYINGSRNTAISRTIQDAVFLLYVRKLPNNDIVQDIYLQDGDVSGYIVASRKSYLFNGNTTWGYWGTQHTYLQSSFGNDVYLNLNGLQNVQISSAADGDALVYDLAATKWENKPINKVTNFAVSLTGWTADTTSQSGTTLYKKQISLTNVYVDCPTIDIGCASGSTLPTVAEQNSYNLLQYCTVDDAVPCLYLYASAIPTTAFYIKVKGVD